MKLTEHFQLSEFEKSTTASAHHIDNHVPAALIPNIKNLCEQVLEPLRHHAGGPVIITSGYRCPELNKLVGGASNSQHVTGQAADIYMADTTKLRQWFLWLIDNVPFDQLIWEKKGSMCWIHVSCKTDLSRNRQKVFKLTI